MAELAQIGVTGLAVMGRNLARNFARHGHRVAIHNRTLCQDRVSARRGWVERGHSFHRVNGGLRRVAGASTAGADHGQGRRWDRRGDR